MKSAPLSPTAHRCARAWSWLILRTTRVDVAVEGLERITPGTTYVFVSNHQSIYDIPVIFWTLPHQLRIIAKASLGHFPFLGWHLRLAGHLLVERADVLLWNVRPPSMARLKLGYDDVRAEARDLGCRASSDPAAATAELLELLAAPLPA